MTGCLSDHVHTTLTQQGMTAGDNVYVMHKIRCDVCGEEVLYLETPVEVARREKVESDDEAR